LLQKTGGFFDGGLMKGFFDGFLMGSFDWLLLSAGCCVFPPEQLSALRTLYIGF
jgi:hypothetical protein